VQLHHYCHAAKSTPVFPVKLAQPASEQFRYSAFPRSGGSDAPCEFSCRDLDKCLTSIAGSTSESLDVLDIPVGEGTIRRGGTENGLAPSSCARAQRTRGPNAPSASAQFAEFGLQRPSAQSGVGNLRRPTDLAHDSCSIRARNRWHLPCLCWLPPFGPRGSHVSPRRRKCDRYSSRSVCGL
jgi:hypothetical protein